ncbi:MAG: sigma-70 family RNA polymerase sigma factor [Chloroflexota bacterium]
MDVTINAVKRSVIPPPSIDLDAAIQEHWARIYGVLFRLTGDPDDAEDLALEVFYRLHQKPPPANDALNLGGWLYRVAMNLGYNALRAARRRSRYEQEAGALALEEEYSNEPSHEVERRIERRQVRAALACLKPRSAQLLILRHSGLSYAEVAAALQIAPGSVGTLLARAEREFEKAYDRIAESGL